MYKPLFKSERYSGEIPDGNLHAGTNAESESSMRVPDEDVFPKNVIYLFQELEPSPPGFATVENEIAVTREYVLEEAILQLYEAHSNGEAEEVFADRLLMARMLALQDKAGVQALRERLVFLSEGYYRARCIVEAETTRSKEFYDRWQTADAKVARLEYELAVAHRALKEDRRSA